MGEIGTDGERAGRRQRDLRGHGQGLRKMPVDRRRAEAAGVARAARSRRPQLKERPSPRSR